MVDHLGDVLVGVGDLITRTRVTDAHESVVEGNHHATALVRPWFPWRGIAWTRKAGHHEQHRGACSNRQRGRDDDRETAFAVWTGEVLMQTRRQAFSAHHHPKNQQAQQNPDAS